MAYLPNFPVVSVLGFFLKALPLLQHFGVGERYPVDPLERLHVRAAFPVRGGVLDKSNL